MNKSPPLPFFILRGHEGGVTALQFNNEKDDVINIQPTLLSGSDNGEIFIWNLKSFRSLFKLTSPEKKTILFLKYYKSQLFSQSTAGVINIWSYCNSNWSIAKKYSSDLVGFCASVFWLSGNQAFITLANQDIHVLEIYNIADENKTKALITNSSKGLYMCVKAIKLGDKQFFLLGFEDGTIELLDSENSKIQAAKLHKQSVMCLDFDSEFKMRGISGGADEFLQIWSINESHCIENVHQLTLTETGTSDVKIRQDGKIVIAAGWDFRIRIFSWKSLKPLAILNFHEQSVHCLACSPFPVDKKNSVFASGSKDKSIALWTIY